MRKAWIVVIVVLLIAAALFQYGFDATPAGAGEEAEENLPAMRRLMDFLGGVRQYLAYSLYIKNDKLHHLYFGGLQAEAELVPYFILITWLDPHYVDAYFIGSDIIYQQGGTEEAFDFIKQGIAANPESADLHAGLADFYLEEERYEEARQEFEKALRYEPQIYTRNFLLRGLAASYHALGDDQTARRLLTEIAISDDVQRYTEDLDYDQVKAIVTRINNTMKEIFPAEDDTEQSL
jgi:tetratricopeptide (TPR) repeat protein